MANISPRGFSAVNSVYIYFYLCVCVHFVKFGLKFFEQPKFSTITSPFRSLAGPMGVCDSESEWPKFQSMPKARVCVLSAKRWEGIWGITICIIIYIYIYIYIFKNSIFF